jgi:arylformamidase
MAKIYDISLTITPGLPVWPGDPPVMLSGSPKWKRASTTTSRSWRSARMPARMSMRPITSSRMAIRLSSCRWRCWLGRPRWSSCPRLRTDHRGCAAAGRHRGWQRVLLKTRNSRYWTQPGLPSRLTLWRSARMGPNTWWQRGIRLIGIDYFSIAPFGDSVPTHRVLLGAKLVILEGADLSQVPAGHYELYCLPLKLGGSDGAPARAILIG